MVRVLFHVSSFIPQPSSFILTLHPFLRACTPGHLPDKSSNDAPHVTSRSRERPRETRRRTRNVKPPLPPTAHARAATRFERVRMADGGALSGTHSERHRNTCRSARSRHAPQATRRQHPGGHDRDFGELSRAVLTVVPRARDCPDDQLSAAFITVCLGPPLRGRETRRANAHLRPCAGSRSNGFPAKPAPTRIDRAIAVADFEYEHLR
jgi:hypothetical protein